MIEFVLWACIGTSIGLAIGEVYSYLKNKNSKKISDNEQKSDEGQNPND